MGFKIICVSKTKNLAIHFQNNVIDKVSMSKRSKEFGGMGAMFGNNRNQQDIEALQRVCKLLYFPVSLNNSLFYF